MQNSVVRQFPLAELEVGAQSFTPTHLHSLNQNRPTHPPCPWLKMFGVRGSRRKSHKQPASKTSTNIHRTKGITNRGTTMKIRGKLGGKCRRPPLAEFGANAARSAAGHTTGEGGTGVSPRRCRSRSGSRRSSEGYTETGIVGKIHLDIITTTIDRCCYLMETRCCKILIPNY